MQIFFSTNVHPLMNSDLQVGIWFGSVASSSIISFPPPLCFSCFCLKSRLFWTCAHVQCRLHIFHHIEFYFRLRQRIAFPVWGQLCCACQGDESSTKFSGNIWCTLQKCYMSPFWGLSASLMSSSFLWPCSFFGLSTFWGWVFSFLSFFEGGGGKNLGRG